MSLCVCVSVLLWLLFSIYHSTLITCPFTHVPMCVCPCFYCYLSLHSDDLSFYLCLHIFVPGGLALSRVFMSYNIFCGCLLFNSCVLPLFVMLYSFSICHAIFFLYLSCCILSLFVLLCPFFICLALCLIGVYTYHYSSVFGASLILRRTNSVKISHRLLFSLGPAPCTFQ